MSELPGVGPVMEERLKTAGFTTIASIAKAGVDGLVTVDGIGLKTAEKLVAAAKELVGQAKIRPAAMVLPKSSAAAALFAPDVPAPEMTPETATASDLSAPPAADEPRATSDLSAPHSEEGTSTRQAGEP